MIQVGIITDVQYADIDSIGNRNYRQSIPKFMEAVGSLEKRNVDFILHLGDAINGGRSNLTVMGELFARIAKPFYNVPGNHDFLVPDDIKPEIFRRLRIPESGYFSFKFTDSESGFIWRFVMLNGNEISLYAARNDDERKRAEAVREEYRLADGELPADWNGAMTTSQLDWLDQELAEAEQAGERVIVCNHFPLFSQADSLDAAATIPLAQFVPVYFDKLGVTQWNAEALLAILDRYPKTVRAYLAGHLHEGAYGVRNGIPHVTFKGMVQTEPNVWSVMVLRDEEISFEDFP